MDSAAVAAADAASRQSPSALGHNALVLLLVFGPAIFFYSLTLYRRLNHEELNIDAKFIEPLRASSARQAYPL